MARRREQKAICLFRYADSSACTSDADEVGTALAHPVWRRAHPTGQHAPSLLAAAVVCWRADLTAQIAPRRLLTA